MRSPKVHCFSRVKGKTPSGYSVKFCKSLLKQFKNHRSLKKSLASSPDIDDLTVVFVGASESRRLNRRFRKKDRPTDVLSFSPEVPKEGLGELVLCLPVLRRQAQEQGHSLKRELETMLIHGFLHLLGYDHEKSRKEELKMMTLQDKLLAKMTKT